MQSKISVDDFLTLQATYPYVATVEAVEGEASLLKITPWVSGTGCLCALALKIPKVSVESVTPTGDNHICCGKILRVVEISFKAESSIPLTDLYSQLTQSAREQRVTSLPRVEATQHSVAWVPAPPTYSYQQICLDPATDRTVNCGDYIACIDKEQCTCSPSGPRCPPGYQCLGLLNGQPVCRPYT